jgi:hypothetical protein
MVEVVKNASTDEVDEEKNIATMIPIIAKISGDIFVIILEIAILQFR